MAQVDDEGRDALERDVAAGWQDLMGDKALVLRVRVVVATASK
ncbi:MAG: hypothetical protein R3362_04260 [Rhodothermales bacterium]|nr:hypothetical protein [Rhodothermales bacterium]